MKIELNPDCESEIVVHSLKDYHEIMKDDPEDGGVCNAIEIVLSHYMTTQDYATWYKSVYGTKTND